MSPSFTSSVFSTRHVIAAADVILDHRFAADFQREGVGIGNEILEAEPFVAADGFDRRARCDATQQRDLRRSDRVHPASREIPEGTSAKPQATCSD